MPLDRSPDVDRPTIVGERDWAWLKNAIYAFVGVLLIYCVVRNLVAASARPLWYDEVITWAVCGQGGWRHILSALFRAADSQPPLFYVIEHYALGISSNREIALRLPSILAFPCTLICVFLYVKRRAGETVALACAIFLLTTAPFQWYAVEARAYNMVVACVAFALLCYQRVSSFFWLAAMGVTFALAESLHYFAIFSLLPFAIAELVHSWRERSIRWQVWGAFSCVLLPFFFTWRFLAAFKYYYGPHISFRYDLWSIPATYGSLLTANAAFGVATAVVCGAIVIRARFLIAGGSLSSGRTEKGPVEGTLLFALLLLPLTTYVITKIVHGTMYDRYVLSTILGMALALGCIKSIPKGPAIVVLAFYSMLAGIHEVLFWRSLDSIRVDKPAAPLEMFVQKGGYADLPVAVADGLLYLPLELYASRESRNRFVYLVDEQKAVQYLGSDSIDKNLAVLRRDLPFTMPDFPEFARTHQIFLLYTQKPRPVFDWLSLYLPSVTSSMEVVNEDADQKLYLVKMKRSSQ
jgi:Dolichyl-phosphate-mannose-protein mannosyltransferase